ncbi:hypothetical protein [Inquilinus limosus]|uniref:Portal protein n=1 Tax=Inquilinus limosus MP06 TaxID=1398085 RepID=A0A0A0DE13_9PROT|nr:hypothetical protein [Inquilinus limosus]KGM36138.1 hypothetical protein P409_00385 [Inquilinus limosus MP06]
MAGGILSVIFPKKRTSDKGSSFTSTYNASSNTAVLSKPAYRDHLDDIYTTRLAGNSQSLIQQLAKVDPDLSAALNAYLTSADTEPYFYVRDLEGNIDREGHKTLQQILLSLTTRTDYTKPANFLIKKSLVALCEQLRWFALIRGACAAELVVDKTLLPTELRLVDPGTLEFTEKSPGVYFPEQVPTGSSERISLDLPSFFLTFYRQDPTTIYSTSPFTAAINTIAARQAVINTLYRIMQVTGFPRLEISVLEEVLRKNAPPECKTNETKMKEFLDARLSELQGVISGLSRPDQAFIHYDSVEAKILNDKNPGASLQIKEVIETLNAQNQAALKTMSSVIGRGESGVNTASVEALIFSRNAEQLNGPVADLLSQAFTFALRLTGSESIVTVGFDNVELRPDLELETHLTQKQARYLTLLSYGLISDDDFHIEMFNRIRPDAVPELSGTGFMSPAPADGATDGPSRISSMDRALAPKDKNASKSNAVKK